MDAVDTWLATYPDSPIILDLFGTTDADLVRARIEEVVPDAEEVFFFGASVGALYGLRRRDGSRVAVKVNKLYDDPRYFEDVQRVQLALHRRGFPAPRPLGVHGTTIVEEWVDEGEYRDAHDPDVRRVLASTLARFVELASATGVRPDRPSIRPPGELWPKPHSAIFDFASSHEGAEWIDAIAAQARTVTDPGVGREVVGHLDWAVKHLRFDADLRPTVLYDWDSVVTDREPVFVGSAAASFTYTTELEISSFWPSTDQLLAFIREYEEARGEPFTAEEHRAARAAGLFLLAYAARCGWAYVRRADRASLEAYAEALL